MPRSLKLLHLLVLLSLFNIFSVMFSKNLLAYNKNYCVSGGPTTVQGHSWILVARRVQVFKSRPLLGGTLKNCFQICVNMVGGWLNPLSSYAIGITVYINEKVKIINNIKSSFNA